MWRSSEHEREGEGGRIPDTQAAPPHADGPGGVCRLEVFAAWLKTRAEA
jgi:hypothetical protein